MNSFFAKALALILVAGMAVPAMSQNPASTGTDKSVNHPADPDRDFKGFNEYEEFRGMVNSSGTLLKLDSTLGYDFNRYFGVFTGVPLYFASDNSNTPGQTRMHDAGAGDVYFGADVYLPNRLVNFSSTLTVSAPTGSVSNGFSPGSATVDWNNRFRHSFGKLTPFVALGVGNTVPDSELVTRSFISLGTVAHFEEGAEFQLARPVYVGASAYQIVPSGNQQVFNRFGEVVPQDNNGGKGNGAAPSESGVDLTKEHGFDAWIGFEPTRVMNVELGYSRSATFALNSFSFNVGLNVGKLLRSKTR